MGGLIGVLGLGLAWRVGRHLGGPLAGLLALLLLGTLPSWWGHMFFNSKDIPFAVGMLGSIAAWIRVLDEWPRPSLGSALWLGLAVGLTLGIRIGGIILVVYFALTVVAVVLSARGGTSATDKLANTVRAGLRLLPALPLAIAVLVPAWPWVALAPGNLLEAIVYLGVSLHRRHDLPRPALPGTVRAAGILADLAGVPADRDHAGGARCRAPSAWLGSADERRRLGILTVVIAASCPGLRADRAPNRLQRPAPFRFVLPPLAFWPALAWPGRCPSSAPARDGRRRDRGGLPVASDADRRLHPYEYVYFNDLSGGVRAAASRFELDYWGTSFAELGRLVVPALAAHGGELGTPPIPARICGPIEASRDVLPPSLLPVRHDSPADLAMAIAIFFCVEPPPGSEIACVERPGRALSRAYLRGLRRGDHELHQPLRPSNPAAVDDVVWLVIALLVVGGDEQDHAGDVVGYQLALQALAGHQLALALGGQPHALSGARS